MTDSEDEIVEIDITAVLTQAGAEEKNNPPLRCPPNSVITLIPYYSKPKLIIVYPAMIIKYIPLIKNISINFPQQHYTDLSSPGNPQSQIQIIFQQST